MATYTTLKVGSSGSDVTKLQQSLKDAGYNITVDGSFGNQTQSVVKQYQKDNGLIVDGLAGDQTLGKLYGSTTGTGTTDTGTTTTPSVEYKPYQQKTPDQYAGYSYDPNNDTAYQQALAALNSAKGEVPTYAGTYDQQLNDLYNKIVNREKFSYDVNADALYQQYANQYTTLGQQAMQDTMGQAAALTGGYGSTYAQSVGQQQYNAYLQKLNDVIPDLYNAAYSRYSDEGDALLSQYNATGALADREYSRYQDDLSNYWTNLNYLQNTADDAYDRGYNQWYQSYQMGLAADQEAYDRSKDSYENLVNLITSTGYTPSNAELEAAGMSTDQANAYRKYYTDQQAAASSGGSGSSGSSSSSRRYSATPSSDTSSDKPASTTTYNDAITAINAYVKNNGGYDTKRYTKQMVEPYSGVTYLWDTQSGKWVAKSSVQLSGADLKSGLLTESQWKNDKAGFSTYSEYLDWFISEYL